jgi:O-antigen ligase
VGQIVFVLALGSWLAQDLAKREIQIPTPPLITPLLGLLGLFLVTLWSPVDVWVGFLELAKWVQILLIFLFISQRIQNDTRDFVVGLVIAVLLGSGLVQASVGLWQFVGRGDGPEAFLISGRLYRAYGTFQQPNPYAGFVGMVAAVAVGLSAGMWDQRFRSRDPEKRWVTLRRILISVVAIWLVGGLVASWSRGGWMGFGGAILGIAVLFPRRRLWGVVGLVIMLAVGWMSYRAGWLPTAISGRMTGFLAYTRFTDVRGVAVTDASYAVLERMAHWQAAFSMWRDHFWLGVGLGCYEPAYAAYRLANWPMALGHAHNVYFNMLAETGLLGLSGYLLWLGIWGRRLIATLRRQLGWRRGLTLGLIGAWCQFTVHSLVDNLLVNDVHLHIGVMLALSAWILKTGD